MEQKRNVFDRLKVLFSTDVIIRSKDGDEIKVLDVNHIQNSGAIETNSMLDKHSKIYSPNTTSMMGAQLSTNYKYMRPFLYSDYDLMDGDAIVASALDIIADESTLKNEQGEVLQIRSNDEEIQKILYNLFYDVLNIEFNLWSWVRQMCKYGDFFLKLEIAEKFGVYNVIPYTAYHMEREEGYDKDNPSSVKFMFSQDGLASGNSGYYSIPNTKDGTKPVFENYEIAHFRMIADTNYLPYGRSYLEPARRLYKQYTLMEDSMLIHRIVRAPEKRIFYINVGSIPSQEIESFMQKTMTKMKRTPHIDTTTGEYNLRYNMQNSLEDFYIPVRGNDQTTKIENLPGLQWDGINDVIYLRDKLFAALKVPKAFMGYEAELCISPDTLIPLLDGRTIPVKEIINEFKEGKKNYVYSIDEETKNITPGEIEWAGFTRMNAQILRVWLDNEKFIDCTPDHNFLTREGEWKEAQNLTEGESLMPLYLRKSKNKIIEGYNEVYNPSDGKYKFVHRLVAEYYNLKQNNKVIHHIDCNKLNNNPENLDGSMDFWEHRKWHTKHNMLCHTPEAKEKRKKTWAKRMEDPILYKEAQDRCKKNSKTLVQWIKDNGASRKGFIKNPKKICIGCNNIFDKTFLPLSKRNNKYCSQECKINNSRSKYKNITLNELVNNANKCQSFKELKLLLNIKDSSTLNKVFKNLKIDKAKFIIENMPLAHNNYYIMNQLPETNKFYIDNFNPKHHEWKSKYNYKNHKVSKIEWLDKKIDTCDLTISKYHNFGTEAGVIIHNSGKATLAAEDIRFGRTIDRIQRIILSELYKIALIHLYTQGYNKDELTNFELLMTTPSIIYDQERIALMKEKVELAASMMENKILPTDYIYHNVFHLSEEQSDEYRIQLIEDAKREFRLKQIAEEGNDPKETGKSFGTPHDLASLYGVGRMQKDPGNVPKGYNKDSELGRPTAIASNSNKQDSAFGNDRLGKKGMENQEGSKSSYSNMYENKSIRVKNKAIMESLEKNIVSFKNKKNDPDLLNENLLNENLLQE